MLQVLLGFDDVRESKVTQLGLIVAITYEDIGEFDITTSYDIIIVVVVVVVVVVLRPSIHQAFVDCIDSTTITTFVR